MNVTYTGKQERFYPTQTKKMEAKFGKLAKLLDGRGEKQAHVILIFSKNRHKAEITVNYMDHTLVGSAADEDQFTAMSAAIDKLEKQVLKVRNKRRDVKRDGTKIAVAKRSESTRAAIEPQPEPPIEETNGARRVYRVNHSANRKPMTLDEAMIEIEKDGDYVVYRDARSDRLSVLMRRPDGHFDLIEG